MKTSIMISVEVSHDPKVDDVEIAAKLDSIIQWGTVLESIKDGMWETFAHKVRVEEIKILGSA